MLTRLIVRNFKKFDEIDVELGNPVVFIGPNNCGKTTALQALALWDLGVRRWSEKRSEEMPARKRTGVAINRRDLIAVPVPDAKILWRNLHTHTSIKENEKSKTQQVHIEIVVEGVSRGESWNCGMKFYFANPESFYCAPLDPGSGKIPELATSQRVSLLPPMSGLAAIEPKLEPGRINVLIGEGQTAQVLRNLCFEISHAKRDSWIEVKKRISELFLTQIDDPEFILERGEIAMTYAEHGLKRLDISATGRGLQQTLLLLAYLYTNPNSVLLLDEPDAHLEILRQRQIYQVVREVAQQQNSQVIVASHSEVVLEEAAGRDVVISFIGHPRRINDRGSQVQKALREIGIQDYYLAEQCGWILYLEGSTDLEILRKLARRLKHKADSYLGRPFVYYVGNQPKKAMSHFQGLRQAKENLVGIAIFDNLGQEPLPAPGFRQLQWERREIENYICSKDALYNYAVSQVGHQGGSEGSLFLECESQRFKDAMEAAIAERVPGAALKDSNDPFWLKTKASDEFLDLLFPVYFEKLGLPNLMFKTNYHELADYVPLDELTQEISEKLDAIANTASQAVTAADS
jgi:AAA15 family ATPase/GTPase